jgi:signal transduction histidine kinase
MRPGGFLLKVVMVALVLGAVTGALVAVAVRHEHSLRRDTDELVRGRMAAVAFSLRRAFRDAPGVPDLQAPEAREWFASEEVADLRAVRLVGPGGRIVTAWERDVGRYPFQPPPPPEPGREEPTGLPLKLVRGADGSEVYRGGFPAPRRGCRGPGCLLHAALGHGPGEERGAGPLLVVLDLYPQAALELLSEGRLLRLGSVALSLALWGLFGVLLAATVRGRRLEAHLAGLEREAELGRMSGVLAHQIRNPLAAIKGFTQLALERLPPQEGVREGLARVVAESSRLERLAARLLQVVRPLEVQSSQIASNELLAEVLAGRPAEQARVDADQPPVALQGDRVLLREALAALLDNALEAAGPRGRVRLGVDSPSPHEVALAVEDDGPGLPEALLAGEVRPFFTTRPAGTGLGLALVQRIAAAHGGRLSLANLPGGGARVALVLPRTRR